MPLLPPPRPLVDSVGDIAGLRPRRHAHDGGEVPSADVDLIDDYRVPTTTPRPLAMTHRPYQVESCGALGPSVP